MNVYFADNTFLNRALFPQTSIPESFLMQLVECTSTFSKYQVEQRICIFSLMFFVDKCN